MSPGSFYVGNIPKQASIKDLDLVQFALRTCILADLVFATLGRRGLVRFWVYSSSKDNAGMFCMHTASLPKKLGRGLVATVVPRAATSERRNPNVDSPVAFPCFPIMLATAPCMVMS